MIIAVSVAFAITIHAWSLGYCSTVRFDNATGSI